jgi:F-type H+-transporting ATPase subunit epsilon
MGKNLKSFSLILRDATSARGIENVVSFVGTDASGSFGLMAGHAYCMTCLELGLARFRCQDGDWQYLAMPGAVLVFRDNILSLCTRRYFIDADYDRITDALTRQLLAEEETLREVKQSLAQLEQEVMRRLWQLER